MQFNYSMVVRQYITFDNFLFLRRNKTSQYENKFTERFQKEIFQHISIISKIIRQSSSENDILWFCFILLPFR